MLASYQSTERLYFKSQQYILYTNDWALKRNHYEQKRIANKKFSKIYLFKTPTGKFIKLY